MAFSSLGANQMVSEIEASTAGFTLNSGQSHGSSTLCMTKSDATIKYNLLASNLSSYSSNQLIPKSVWATGVVADTTAPTTPGTLVGTPYQCYILLSWGASTDAGSVVTYEIWRGGVYYSETTDNFYEDYTYDIATRTYQIKARDDSYNYSTFTNSVSKRALLCP